MNNFLKSMLSKWPVMDMLDFDLITFDATKWEDGNYTLMINFYETGKENPPHRGFTMCTQIGASSLEELYERISFLIETGLFDGVDVNSIGNLLDHNGNDIEEIEWMNFEDSFDESDDQGSPEESYLETITQNKILH